MTFLMSSSTQICTLHSVHHGPMIDEYSVGGTTYSPEGSIFDSEDEKVMTTTC